LNGVNYFFGRFWFRDRESPILWSDVEHVLRWRFVFSPILFLPSDILSVLSTVFL
jgi:hypothetical protein